MDPKPFLRGVAFAGTERVPYPRAKPDDAARLPLDTWTQAQVPAGVRLELTGDADVVEIAYVTATDKLGFRGEGAGTTFQLWRNGALVSEERAALGEGRARLKLGTGPAQERVIVYLPEGMKPRVVALDAAHGTIEPAPAQPRWVCYGDSIAEGWSASSPALSWAATVARDYGLDVINMGYAGAARGEIVSAEHVASLAADVITLAYGTNCWNRIPHSEAQMTANLDAFLDVVRRAHQTTPVLVCSPLLRPEAEETKNILGATLSDLRSAMEHVVRARIADGDERLSLVEGLPIIDETGLADPTHPNDDGHRAIAASLGPRIARLAEGSR